MRVRCPRVPEVSCAHTDASVYSELMLILNVQVAPMVDQGLFQLEGMVPWGNNNTYKMPVNVYVFGPPDPAHADMVKHRLLRAGMQIGSWGEPLDANDKAYGQCMPYMVPKPDQVFCRISSKAEQI